MLLQVYLRSGAKHFGKDNVVGQTLDDLANLMASAMIPYKNKRMEDIREMIKKAPETVTVQTSNQPTQPLKPTMRDRIFGKNEEEF